MPPAQGSQAPTPPDFRAVAADHAPEQPFDPPSQAINIPALLARLPKLGALAMVSCSVGVGELFSLPENSLQCCQRPGNRLAVVCQTEVLPGLRRCRYRHLIPAKGIRELMPAQANIAKVGKAEGEAAGSSLFHVGEPGVGEIHALLELRADYGNS